MPDQPKLEGPSTVSEQADCGPANASSSKTALASSGPKIRCPHCYNPLHVSQARGEQVLCPACGESFQMRDSRLTDTTSQMRQLGKFQLLEQVGAGAFGAVWRAYDTELDRAVALKIPHADLLQSRQGLERFQREARAAAQLRHPNIVTVHEVEMLEGKTPAIVADFVEGVTLRELLQFRRLTFRESAEVLAILAEALDYAHNMGLVHRDLKPGNVMLERTSSGVTKVSNSAEAAATGAAASDLGKPMLMDFGLALRGEDEITMTLDGQIIGTPAYMSPEQAAGRGHHVDRRGDVYSFGVLLYELLCGELPFRGTRHSILYQVLHTEPLPPRRLIDKVPRDLEIVCLKALAKEPGRRYPTARAFADDLRRFLAGQPIQARPVRAWERAWLWARRHPATASLLVVSFVAALALVGLAVGWMANSELQDALAKVEKAKGEAETARQNEEQQRGLAEEALKREQIYLYLNRIGLAHNEWLDNNLPRANELLAVCPKELCHWEWDYLHRLCHSEVWAAPLDGHALALAVHPEGKQLAVAQMSDIRLLDALNGKELFRLPVKCLVTHGAVAFSPDGLRLAAASWNGKERAVEVWDLPGRKRLFRLEGHTDSIRALSFSKDSQVLASGGLDRTVKLWDMQNGKMLKSWLLTTSVDGVTFSPDGVRLAASYGGTIREWDYQSGKVIGSIPASKSSCQNLVYSPDGKYVAAGFATGFGGGTEQYGVAVWNLKLGTELHLLTGHTVHPAVHVAYAPDGKTLASGGQDNLVILWDLDHSPKKSILKGHTEPVVNVAFTPDGQFLVSLTGKEVRLWQVDTRQEQLQLLHEQRPVSASTIAFSREGKYLASGGYWSHEVHLWRAETGQHVRILPCKQLRVNGLAFHPKKNLLASAAGSIQPFQGKTPPPEVKFWDHVNGEVVLSLAGLTDPVHTLAFSPDGKYLVTAEGQWTAGGPVNVWDSDTGQKVRILATSNNGSYQCLAFSQDGKCLAGATNFGRLTVWQWPDGEELLDLPKTGLSLYAVRFSPDNRHLAVAAASGEIQLWDVPAQKLVKTFKGHNSIVAGVAFSADGKRLVSGSWDRTVRLWDVHTGAQALSLKVPDAKAVRSVAISPDGSRIAAGSDGNTVIWEAAK